MLVVVPQAVTWRWLLGEHTVHWTHLPGFEPDRYVEPVHTVLGGGVGGGALHSQHMPPSLKSSHFFVLWPPLLQLACLSLQAREQYRPYLLQYWLHVPLLLSPAYVP